MTNDGVFDRTEENIEDIGHWVSGTEVSSDRFLATMPFKRLMGYVPNPLTAADPKHHNGNPQLSDYHKLQEMIQREFDKGKKANANNYAEYIIKICHGAPGDTPTIDLFTPIRLRVEIPQNKNEKHRLLWPHRLTIVPYDGETQLAARFLAAEKDPATEDMPVIVTIRHGAPVEHARQCFHDRNAFQRKVTVGVAMAMDSRDPWIETVRAIEQQVPGVKGAIVWGSRQMSAKGKQYIGAASFLRTAVACFANGISGVQRGSPELPTGFTRDSFEEVAIVWFSRVIKTLAPYMKDREKYVASSPAIWAALGAMGHSLVKPETLSDSKSAQSTADELIAKIRDVNWQKDNRWVGIAIKSTRKGGYSFAGGAKDSGSIALKALMDSNDDNYELIRQPGAIAVSA